MKKKSQAVKNEMGLGFILALAFIFFSQFPVFAQTVVTGKVVAQNDSATAIAGATVRIKGANASVVTGSDGSFTIKTAPNAVLIISSVGYATQEVAVNGRSSIMARMIVSRSAKNRGDRASAAA